jgi:leucine dehydrogenase
MRNKELILRELKIEDFEQVVEVINEAAHLHAIIAIHSTHLGPACGGIRAYPYTSFDQALTDVLRLAKGMTYKSAVAETGTGGAKSVLILNKLYPKSEEMLLAFADAVNAFKGRYYGGEDMGITPADLLIMHQLTPYVVGLTIPGSSGDPSVFTARGAYRGIQAVCQKLWKNSSVRGKKIAIQGLGSVGMKLIQHLFWAGAHLIVTDVNPSLVEEAINRWGATGVASDQIFQVECDIFSPCAIGGILNSRTIPHLKCQAVAGVANNQLLTDEDSTRLVERHILYAPDFVINAGGLINISSEVGHQKYQPVLARNRIDHLYDLLLSIFDQAEKSGKSPHQIAIEIAEHHLHEPIRKFG